MRTFAASTLISLAVTTQAFAAENDLDHTDRFAAPNGQLGAGISFSGDPKGRAYAELAFTRAAASEDALGATIESHINGLSLLLGGAYRVLPALEIEAMLPIAWAQYGTSLSALGQSQSTHDGGFAVLNFHIGASYLRAERPWRLKVGGALEWGPWTNDFGQTATVAVLATHAAYGGEHLGLWAPEAFSIVAPARFEYGERLVVSGDAQLGLHISTSGGDSDLSIQLAPGIGYYANNVVLVGLRTPLTWIPTESGTASTFFAVQPYGRFDLGAIFLDTSIVLNIDDPYGFAFDSGKFWALHFGGGGSF
jgi:hypothetical protein